MRRVVTLETTVAVMEYVAQANASNGQRLIYLWLDDDRPAPEGWIGVTTIVDAKLHLETGRVDRASLDHDLGACETCMDGMDVDEWLEAHHFRTMPHCKHVGTGYDLCVWMAQTGYWPKEKPTVHSANRVGRRRMNGVIAKYFPRHH
jgi:NAD+-processing family protein with receiver domain